MNFFSGIIVSFKQDSLWSWFICGLTTLCVILTVGFSSALGVLFPVFMNSFGENRESTAWVASIIQGLFLILGPVMGAFLNKFGFRVTTIVGCLLCSLGVTLGSFVSTIYMLYVTFSIPFAIGQSLVFVSEAIIVNNYFDKRKSFALGLVTSGQGLGTMILSPSLQAAVDILEWRSTFRVFGGLLAVSSLTGVILHQSPSSQEGSMNCSSKKWSWNRSLFKNSTILVLATTGTAFMFSRLVPYVHLMKHCDDLGILTNKSSTIYMVIGTFALLAASEEDSSAT
ncbi:monocarboxylate transporter 4-like [Pocillopora damicornis]|uniref:monocarboxylate transporter 4-like n=1 Tax=Pocillopora damicornis TaxID=46731 RepID=UPI000F54D364|nr:monocarboxylate transporter 4-like [Pocillopora damicornis]